MRRLVALVVAVLLVVAVAAPVGATHSDERRGFIAVLKGGNEVPPNESDGFGLTILGVNRAETALGFALLTFNTENILQAHIHCGARDVNGPVVAFLFGPEAPPGVTKNGLLSHGVITNADVLPKTEAQGCPGGIADFDDLLAQMRAGNTYVNVHTVAFPPGEIRGQIK